MVFHEVLSENLYSDSVPATALLINGWVRQGHPAGEAARLALEIARVGSRITGLPEAKVLVVIQSSPAGAAVEGGRALPEPGQEATWIAEQRAD